MLTFSPPSGFYDVSEYTFNAKGRRVIVRPSHELGSSGDLALVAKDYAGQLTEFLGATNVQTSEVSKRADGSQYATVVAELIEGSHPVVERSAFILFGNGVSVHLSVTAKPDDSDAASEFDRLLQTVQPSRPVSQKRMLSAEPADGAAPVRRAGAVMISLPGEYQDATVLKFQNPEGTHHLSMKVDEAPAAALQAASTTAAAAPPPGLYGAKSAGQDGFGRAFAFESGADPWKARTALQAKAVTASAGASAAERTATVVRDVGGRRVRIHVRSSEPDAQTTLLAQQVSQSIQSDK